MQHVNILTKFFMFLCLLQGGSEVWTTEKNTVIASLAFHPTDKVLVVATFNEIYFWDWFQPHPFTKISTADEKEKIR